MTSKIDMCEITCINQETVLSLKAAMPAAATINSLAEIFKMLGDPTRVRIVFALTQKELCVCEIAAVLDMSQSAVSHQLRLLRNTRLVKFRKEGKIVYYSIDDRHIHNLFKEGLDHVSHS